MEEAMEFLDEVESTLLQEKAESALALLGKLDGQTLESSVRGRALALGVICREDLDQVEEAQQLIVATMKDEEDDPAFVLSAATQFDDLGAPDQAEIFLRNLCEIDPDSPMSWFILAELLSQYARFEDAIGYFKKALQRDPSFASAHLGMAESLYEAEKVQDAIVAYEGYLELEPRDSEVWKTLGGIQCSVDNKDASYRAYEHAVRTTEDAVEVYFDWALSALELDDTECAERCAESIEQILPETWHILLIRADLIEREGDTWNAWETICEALDSALDEDDEPEAAEYVAADLLRFARRNELGIHVGGQIDRIFDNELFSEEVLVLLMDFRGRVANDVAHYQVVLTGPLTETEGPKYFRVFGVAAQSNEDAAREAIEFERKCIGIDWEVFDTQAISEVDEGLLGVLWRSDPLENPPLVSPPPRGAVGPTESP